MDNIKKMLEEAQQDFKSNMNWMDFSNKYFGIGNPYVPKKQSDRKEFIESTEYKEVQNMKFKLEEQQSDVTEPERTYSGAISLRVPKSLHRALIEEADQEGVSLNQLILAKITASLYDQLRDRR